MTSTSGMSRKSRGGNGIMSPPPIPGGLNDMSSLYKPSGSSSLNIANSSVRRPSSAASSSSRTTYGPSSMSRRRRLEDLVHASVPSARPRRSELDRRKVEEREKWKTELLEMVEDVLTNEKGNVDENQIDQTQLIASFRKKLSKHDLDGGQGSSVRMEMLISKLKKQPDLSRNLESLLTLINGLGFTNRIASYGQENTTIRSRSTSKLDLPTSNSNSRLPSPLIPSSSSNNIVEKGTIDEKREDSQMASQMAGLQLSKDDKMLPKARMLEQWRARKGIKPIPESELLQDILYLLQGINGKYIGFEDFVLPASNDVGESHEASKAVKIKFSPEGENLISQPTKHLIHQIAELGRLYKRIDEFHQERSQKEGTGLIMQSLCHFLSKELTDYYRLVAILEAQMNQQDSKENGPSKDNPKRLTLRRVAVWTEDVLLRMRLISTIIEGCQDIHGGAIVSLIHSYTFHGDPLIRKFIAEILDHVSKPFFHALSLWIFEGELQDPFDEFFVEANKDLKATWGPTGEDMNSALYMSISQDHVAPPSSLWQNQFRFRAEMLPSFLRESFGRKIFSTGKSLNFIRFSCDDADWVAEQASIQKRKRNLTGDGEGDTNAILRYANLPGLERTIDEAYASASTRLLDIFLGKFKLMEHLRALKEYLMLTKGDFTDLLMESIGPSLDKPASSLFRHNLTASLETYIRGSNSQFDDVDIVSRLDARILEFSGGDLGWDSFTLEYRVDEPVNTVLDNHAMLGYQIIFNHLWKVKRVELALGAGWEKLLLAANMLRRSQPRSLRKAALARRSNVIAEKEAVAQSEGDLEMIRLAHVALGNLSEQIQFVKQMQGFVNLEVIEYSWNDLTQLFASHSTNKTRQMDLDELISTHRAYLNTLISKIMLRGVTNSSSGKRANNDQLAIEVKANLDTMLAFAIAIEDLARFIVEELAKKDLNGKSGATVNRSSTPINSSRPGTPSLSGVKGTQALASTSLENIQNRLKTNHAKFRSSTQVIIAKLEKHSNLVVRDLATRLNFNSYYSHLLPSAGTSAPRQVNENKETGEVEVK